MEEFLEGDGFVAVAFSGRGARQDEVDGPEEVRAEGAEATGAALAELDEVVDEDIGLTDGALKRDVARVVHRRLGRSRVRCTGELAQLAHGVLVVLTPVHRNRVAVDLVAGGSWGLEPVRVERRGLSAEGGVGEVSYRFGHGAEARRGLRPTHGTRHRDGHELVFVGIAREDDGEARGVRSAQEHAVESVLDVVLGQVDRAVLGVRVAYAAHNAEECAAELHGFRGSARESRVVHGVPGVVAQEPRLSIAFVFDGSGRELQRGQVPHLGVREHHPEFVFDELGHFFAEEVGVLCRGAVAPLCYTLVAALRGPRFGGGVHGYTMVSPLAEKACSRMLDRIEVFGKVGGPAESGDEGFPGPGGSEAGRQLRD